ncbi:MAG: APC family permease [Planctomycetota bacterium]
MAVTSRVWFTLAWPPDPPTDLPRHRAQLAVRRDLHRHQPDRRLRDLPAPGGDRRGDGPELVPRLRRGRHRDDLGGAVLRRGRQHVRAERRLTSTREAFGPFIGFAVGWAAYASSLLSWSAVAGGASSYLTGIVPALATPAGRTGATVAIILFFGFINYIGIKPAAWTTNVFTVAKLAPLLAFAIIGLVTVPLGALAVDLGRGARRGGRSRRSFACQGSRTCRCRPARPTTRAARS